jgi:HK97 family phage major capsid protein
MNRRYPLSGVTEKRPNFFQLPGNTITADIVEPEFSIKSAILAGAGFIEKPSWERDVVMNNSQLLGISTSNILLRPSQLATRDLSVTGGAGLGAETIQTYVRPAIADALRPYNPLVDGGCTILTDIKGNLSWPRFQAAAANSGYTEVQSITRSGQTFSAMTLSPHSVGTEERISTQWLKQTAFDAESFVRTEIFRSLGSTMAVYSLCGSGNAAEPTGLLNIAENTSGGTDLAKLSPGVPFSGTATYAKLAQFPGTLMAANIIDDGTYGWLVSPATWQKWATTPRATGQAFYLIDQDGTCLKYPVYVTSALSATNQCIFARFSDVVCALYAIEIQSDPFTLATIQTTRLIVNAIFNVNVLRALAVVRSEDSAAA